MKTLETQIRDDLGAIGRIAQFYIQEHENSGRKEILLRHQEEVVKRVNSALEKLAVLPTTTKLDAIKQIIESTKTT